MFFINDQNLVVKKEKGLFTDKITIYTGTTDFRHWGVHYIGDFVNGVIMRGSIKSGTKLINGVYEDGKLHSGFIVDAEQLIRKEGIFDYKEQLIEGKLTKYKRKNNTDNINELNRLLLCCDHYYKVDYVEDGKFINGKLHDGQYTCNNIMERGTFKPDGKELLNGVRVRENYAYIIHGNHKISCWGRRNLLRETIDNISLLDDMKNIISNDELLDDELLSLMKKHKLSLCNVENNNGKYTIKICNNHVICIINPDDSGNYYYGGDDENSGEDDDEDNKDNNNYVLSHMNSVEEKKVLLCQEGKNIDLDNEGDDEGDDESKLSDEKRIEAELNKYKYKYIDEKGAINRGLFNNEFCLVEGEKISLNGVRCIGSFVDGELVNGFVYKNNKMYRGSFINNELVDGEIINKLLCIVTKGTFINEKLHGDDCQILINQADGNVVIEGKFIHGEIADCKYSINGLVNTLAFNAPRFLRDMYRNLPTHNKICAYEKENQEIQDRINDYKFGRNKDINSLRKILDKNRIDYHIEERLICDNSCRCGCHRIYRGHEECRKCPQKFLMTPWKYRKCSCMICSKEYIGGKGAVKSGHIKNGVCTTTKLITPDGKKRVGEITNNMLNGAGKMFIKNKLIYSGTFVDDKLTTGLQYAYNDDGTFDKFDANGNIIIPTNVIDNLRDKVDALTTMVESLQNQLDLLTLSQ